MVNPRKTMLLRYNRQSKKSDAIVSGPLPLHESIQFSIHLHLIVQNSVQGITFHLFFRSCLSPLFWDSFAVFLVLCVLSCHDSLTRTPDPRVLSDLLPWLCLSHWLSGCHIGHITWDSCVIPGDVSSHHLVKECLPCSPHHITSLCFPSPII